jgi:hypothetical protein
MNGIRRVSGTAALLLGLAALTGCGPRYKLTPVEGVVKIGGRPAANISVQFLPDAQKGARGPTSFGTTDAQGKFRLKTQDGQDGAVVGPHLVLLADLDEERPAQGREAQRAPRLAARYTTASGALAAEVKEGGPPVELNAGP